MTTCIRFRLSILASAQTCPATAVTFVPTSQIAIPDNRVISANATKSRPKKRSIDTRNTILF